MGSSPRSLSWKDKFVWELTQTVLARFDDHDDFADRYVFPDMDTLVPLVLYLSQAEWTQLYSAVLTGADLTYPDQSHNVELLFLQTVGLPMAQLCAALADCIENSSDVSDSLFLWLQQNGYGKGDGNPTEPLPPGITETSLLPEGYTCDDDAAYGMSLAIVNSIHEATEEVLQAIEVLTNPLELAAEMADNIPGASVLTAGADIAAWIQDSAAEGYDLAWSSVVRDELACLLWCAFKFECELSFDTIWNIYLNESGITPPTETDLMSWLSWLIDIAFGANRQTVATISLLGLLVMRYGTKFGKFTLGIRSMEMVMALAADDTSDDWEIVCDTCEWYKVYDFTIDEQGWYVNDPASQWYTDPGAYAEGLWFGAINAREISGGWWGRTLYIQLDVPDPTTITMVRVTHAYQNGNWGSGGLLTQMIVVGASSPSLYEPQSNGTWTFQFNGDEDVSFVRVFDRCSKHADEETADSGWARITKIEMWGEGTPPT